MGTASLSNLRWDEMVSAQKFPSLPTQRYGMTAPHGDITKLFGDNLGFMRCPSGHWRSLFPINFPRGLQKTERGKRICCKTHSKDRFQLCKAKRYWMCPEKSPPQKTQHFSKIQVAHSRLQFKFILPFHAPVQPEVSR